MFISELLGVILLPKILKSKFHPQNLPVPPPTPSNTATWNKPWNKVELMVEADTIDIDQWRE